MYVFLVCLVISLFIWLSIKMSQDYQTVIPVRINFTNLPLNKSLTSYTDTVVTVELSERGTDLIRIKYFEKEKEANVSIKNLRFFREADHYKGYLHTSNIINQVEFALGLTGKILAIYPDTLVILMEERISRKVPVTAEWDIGLEQQFMLYGDISYKPDSVVVTGPDRIIRELTHAPLGLIKLTGLNSTVELEREIRHDSTTRWVDFQPKEILVEVPVEKYTEATIHLPVTIARDSTNLNFKTFPDEVEVTYVVALRDFNSVTPEMFRVVADFSQIDIAHDNKIRVRMALQPEMVTVTAIVPEKVEFIILQ